MLDEALDDPLLAQSLSAHLKLRLARSGSTVVREMKDRSVTTTLAGPPTDSAATARTVIPL